MPAAVLIAHPLKHDSAPTSVNSRPWLLCSAPTSKGWLCRPADSLRPRRAHVARGSHKIGADVCHLWAARCVKDHQPSLLSRLLCPGVQQPLQGGVPYPQLLTCLAVGDAAGGQALQNISNMAG